jgi:hypothetical protein
MCWQLWKARGTELTAATHGASRSIPVNLSGQGQRQRASLSRRPFFVLWCIDAAAFLRFIFDGENALILNKGEPDHAALRSD